MLKIKVKFGKSVTVHCKKI